VTLAAEVGGAAPAVRRRLPLTVPAAILGAWALAVVAESTGKAQLLHHDALIQGNLPFLVALLLFLVAWQVMVAAMMLPSTLPMVRMFRVASAKQDRPGAVLAAFVGGYVVVWTVFGAAAFVGDLGLHRTVDALPWLQSRPWLVSGAILAVAGGFQFTDLKDRCLDKCRHPGVYLMRHYGRGVDTAFRIGRGHGLFCLGCCWALMLMMFAAGVANLPWMAVLTGVMFYEKAGQRGRAVTPYVGMALLAWAALVLVHPAWLPHAVAGVA